MGMMRLCPIKYGVKLEPSPLTFLGLFGFRFAGPRGLYIYEATGGVVDDVGYEAGETSPPVSLGGGYLTYDGNLYQWADNSLALIGAVPYGGVGVDFDGTNVRQLSVTGETATDFNMTRITYDLAGSTLSTSTFDIPKLDGHNDTDIRLFQNSAEFTQQRKNGSGSVNVSAWFSDDTQIARPINPAQGTGTFYSAWATSTANLNHTVYANGNFYALGGNVRTWLAVFPSNSGTPTNYYEISSSADVPAFHCADDEGNIWLTIESTGETLKFDQDLNLLETFTGTVYVDGGNIAAIVN